MKKTISKNLTLVLQIFCLAVMAVSTVLFQARMESSVYNKLTGANTTWWDAVWVDLRVIGETK